MIRIFLPVLILLLLVQVVRQVWLQARKAEPQAQLDPELQLAVHRLHRIQVSSRWLFNGLATIVSLPIGLWRLRDEFQLWSEHFTWVAVRYALAFHPWATLCILMPVALIVATLVWQTRNILLGLSYLEVQRLEKQVRRIQKRGPKHPLWSWVFGTRRRSLSSKP